VKYVIAFAAAFLAAVLAASVMPYIHVLGVTPDLVLIFAACWAIVRGHREAMVVVPMAAVVRDLTTSDPVGTSILALAPIVLLAFVVREIRPVESEFLPALAVVAAASLAYSVISMTVLTIVGDDVPLGRAFFRVTLPLMLVNPLFAVLVYPPIRWLSRRPRRQSFGVGSAVQL
jgi:rod shape-determining protein MreD